jgi:hypothetical protein
MFNRKSSLSQEEMEAQRAFLNDDRVSPKIQSQIRNQGDIKVNLPNESCGKKTRNVKTQSRDFDKIDRITVQLLSEFNESDLELPIILSMIEVRYILLRNLRKD